MYLYLTALAVDCAMGAAVGLALVVGMAAWWWDASRLLRRDVTDAADVAVKSVQFQGLVGEAGVREEGVGGGRGEEEKWEGGGRAEEQEEGEEEEEEEEDHPSLFERRGDVLTEADRPVEGWVGRVSRRVVWPLTQNLVRGAVLAAPNVGYVLVVTDEDVSTKWKGFAALAITLVKVSQRGA